MTRKLVRLPGGKWVSEADAARTAAFEQGEPVGHQDELWSILDWSFWGAGMSDTFRVPLADTMIKAISAEQHAQALALIARWTELRGERAFQARYEELSGENDHLRAQLAEATARRQEDIDALKKTVGLQGRTLASHCARRDEQQSEIERLTRELDRLRDQMKDTIERMTDAWRSMNLAPRDGTEILGYFDPDEIVPIRWSEQRRCMLGDVAPGAGTYPPGWEDVANGLPVDDPQSWKPKAQ